MTAPRLRGAVTVLFSAVLIAAAGCDSTNSSGDHRPATGHPADRPAGGKPAEHPEPGDFDNDGFDDYVDIVISQSKDSKKRAETLVVVPGSREGLDTGSVRRTSAGTQQYAGFTTAPLRTDLDGDGFTDLVGSRGASGTVREVFALFGAR